MILTALIIVADQISKVIVSGASRHLPIDIVRGVCSLTLVHNTGGAFGIFRDRPYLFIAISAAAIVALVWMMAMMKGRTADYYALALILGGAVGNLIDRVRLGHVIDFIDFKVWPVFNIADSAITVGVVIFIVDFCVGSLRNRKPKTDKR